MFRKILHRDIDERLQARLDMIAGLFDDQETRSTETDNGSPADASAPVAEVATTPEATSETAPSAAAEPAEPSASPPPLVRRAPTAKKQGGFGLLNRLREKNAGAGAEGEEEPLTLKASDVHTPARRPSEEALPLTTNLLAKVKRTSEEGAASKSGSSPVVRMERPQRAASAAPQSGDAAPVVRLTPSEAPRDAEAKPAAAAPADAPKPGKLAGPKLRRGMSSRRISGTPGADATALACARYRPGCGQVARAPGSASSRGDACAQGAGRSEGR